MFEHFFDTVDTIGEGMGFPLFSSTHLIEVVICFIALVVMTIVYSKSDRKTRENIGLVFVIMLWLDEAFKHVCLLYSGNWEVDYLPLHLCSINILMITIYHFTKNKVVGNFIYCFSTVGALMAILFPNWRVLPVMNFMHLHSYTIHCLLFIYPVMLTVNKDIVRNYRLVPRMLWFLIAVCVPIYLLNRLWDTNFMFLMQAPEGTPLQWFENWFGSHLLGYLVLVPIALALMYIPFKKVDD